MLVDRLKLPYKEVHVVYDDLAVLPHHWAIAKIKTYTLQEEPFIHVDGDIYIPNPLPDDILKAGSWRRTARLARSITAAWLTAC